MIRLIFFTVLIFFTIEHSLGQGKDTVWVQGKSFLILGDTSFFVDKDTSVILPDTVAVFLKRDTLDRNNRFYKKLKKALYKTTITAELYDLLIDEPDDGSRKPQARVADNYASFPEHAGKIINDIRITKLAVFGTEIHDTTEFKQDSWLIRQGNKIHSYTRRNIIKNHLFFSEGELLDPVALEDSERVLRSLPYIKDTRIIVEPVNEDVVNIVVVVKDTWSLHPGFDYSRLDRWRFHITDRNFFGLGHEFFNELRYDKNNSPDFGYRGIYRIRNIGQSFINADISFAESDDFMNRGIRISRDYVTPEIELAGAVEWSINGRNIIRILPDTVIDFDMRYEYQDAYISHAYPVGSINKRKRVVTGVRFRKYDFLEQPEVRPDSNYNYFDRDQYLFNIGFSKRDYDRSSLIYGFGRTEDIPTGYLLSFTMGKEYNQFYDRWYTSFIYSVGGYVGRLGYFRPTLSVGTFIRNKAFEQSMIKGDLAYFSHLYYVNRFAFRQFFSANYTYGFNRFGNEFIDINNRNGIRGLNSVELIGTKKMVFRSETVSFTPFYIIGFRMALFAFADFAAIQADDEKLLDSKLYQGYGIGFRLRNENLAIKSISIRLGYYPNAPVDAIPYDFNMSGEPFLRYMDFIVRPPSVIDFR